MKSKSATSASSVAKSKPARPAAVAALGAKGAGRPGARPGRGGAGKAPSAPAQGPHVADAEFAAGAARTEQIPPPAEPEIAFAGRSNVGKSSLLNMLLSRRGLARTSSTPGCTRQLNFFDVTVAGSAGSPPRKLAVVDLPGYGYARVGRAESAAWKGLLEGYLQERPTLRAVVILVDVRRGPEQEERDLLEFLALRSDLQVVIAATKLDKLPRSGQKPALAKLIRDVGPGVRVIGTSAEERTGRAALWRVMLDALDGSGASAEAEGVSSSESGPESASSHTLEDASDEA